MDLHLVIDPSSPRRAQLERQLRDAIRSGRLRPGARLPPTRALAEEIGVSRGVAVEAYEQLVAEGWLVARRGAGTRVAEGPAPPPATRSASSAAVPPPIKWDLRTGRPDLALFPRAAWLAALGRALKTLPDTALGYGDPRGYAPLREALAAYLGRARGVVADPDRIVVTGGLTQILPVAFRALGARRVAVEDPGWRGQRRAAGVAGIECVPVRVDDRGIVVDELPGDVDAVVVTPAHQFPLGVVLAPERRTALLEWARRHDVLVIEDDYDAEYRYDREPVGALQGLDPDRVLFCGSASKTLAPGLRLGWAVAPPWFLDRFAEAKDLTDRGTSVFEQAALAELLDRGDVDRHLRRTRRTYRSRRDALVESLGGVRLGGAAAGLHLVAWLGDVDEERAAAAAAEAGVAVDRLHATCTCIGEREPALLLGYASSPEATLRRAAEALTKALSSAG